ncbi:MAG: hypothetical protein LW650_06435 [Planctomycetaceae bacterium]|jgi:predicted O-linked N-acetylglucosamine transferase (SPINDLY family)|nr:hypothetical protein [Phycisphaerales bacterium]MCE2653137.1 hypothetical protein [Planctomycetaceae bacterium]
MDAQALVLAALDEIDADHFAQAEALCRRVLKHLPNEPHAHRVLCNALLLQGRAEQARFHGRRAAALAPAESPFYYSLGRLMRKLGSPDEVAGLMAKAWELDRSHPDPCIAQVEALLWGQRFIEAVRVGAEGLAVHPGSAELAVNRSVALLNLGRADEAVDTLRAARRLAPHHATLMGILASTLNYDDRATAAEVLAVHAEHGRLRAIEEGAVGVGRPRLEWRGGADGGERPLRVVFLSPDFRLHSVGFFALPLIERLDRTRVEPILYHTDPMYDEVSERFEALAARWRHVPLHGDAAIAEMIRADQADVVVELAGLTGGHRLGVVARRPAPVQVTWLGYPNVTGLAAMDARLVDGLTDPVEADGLGASAGAERLVRLSGDGPFLVYRPPTGAPEVAAAPCLASGRITFGCFGVHKKLTPTTLALWAAVLRAVPDSVLLLKNAALGLPRVRVGPPSEAEAKNETVRDLRARLAALGIGPERVRLLGVTAEVADHLRAYGEVDIALDTFPYHGTTTTCEAMHMGVPTVCRVGRTHASRVGLSLLSAVGLGELAAESDEGFVAAAVRLAADRPALGALRSGLRARLAGSSLRDEAGFAARFTAALEGVVRDVAAQQE